MKKKREYDATDAEKEGKRFTVTKRFWVYIGFLAFTLIFTQILQSRATHLFMWFALLMPIAMLAYVLTAFGALRADVVSGEQTVEKNQTYTYELRIVNEYILSYPFVEAILTLPQADSVRCRDRVMKISMQPHSKYLIKHGVSFKFRGIYEIGVRYIYAYDLFRIFRVKLDINSTSEVSVMPRRCYIDDSEAYTVSDSAEKTLHSPYTFDKLEVSDIRDYRPGDGLKSVHWKLSSKSEDLVVKDYNTGTSRMTYVFCDMSARYPDKEPREVTEFRRTAEDVQKAEKREEKKKNSHRQRREKQKSNSNSESSNIAVAEMSDEELEKFFASRPIYDDSEESKRTLRAVDKLSKKRTDSLRIHADNTQNSGLERADGFSAHVLKDASCYSDMNEYCADGVVELAVAAVIRELRLGNTCCLVWFDSRAVAGAFGYMLESYEDFERIFRRFVTAPLTKRENFVTRLSEMMPDNQNSKRIFVTSSLDPNAVKNFCGDAVPLDANSFGSAEVLLYEPYERFAFPSERSIYVENCKEELMSAGLRLAEYRSYDRGLKRV